MTQQQEAENHPSHQITFVKPMVIGAVIGLVLISLFVFPAGSGNPAWGEYWQIRPLVVTPLAGAAGGLFLYFMIYLSNTHGFNKTFAITLGMFGFVVALWMGTVLGLAGTMWN